MAEGLRSPLLPLGLASLAGGAVGRGAGPLPLRLGVPAGVVVVGRGAGPLPLLIGAGAGAAIRVVRRGAPGFIPAYLTDDEEALLLILIGAAS